MKKFGLKILFISLSVNLAYSMDSHWLDKKLKELDEKSKKRDQEIDTWLEAKSKTNKELAEKAHELLDLLDQNLYLQNKSDHSSNKKIDTLAKELNINLSVMPNTSNNEASISQKETFLVYENFNNAGQSDLMRAIIKNDKSLAKKILSSFGLFKDTDATGKNAFHYAAAYGQTEILNMLLSKIFSSNTKDNEGKTPLHYAASNGHLEAVKLLSDKTFDKSPKDNQGKTPRDYAKENGHTEIANYLKPAFGLE